MACLVEQDENDGAFPYGVDVGPALRRQAGGLPEIVHVLVTEGDRSIRGLVPGIDGPVAARELDQERLRQSHRGERFGEPLEDPRRPESLVVHLVLGILRWFVGAAEHIRATLSGAILRGRGMSGRGSERENRGEDERAHGGHLRATVRAAARARDIGPWTNPIAEPARRKCRRVDDPRANPLGHRTGIVTIGAACSLPVSVRKKASNRKLNASLECTSRSSIQNQ